MKITLKESEFKALIENKIRKVLDESNIGSIAYRVRDLQNKDIFTKEDLSRILGAIQLNVDESTAYKLYELDDFFGIKRDF